MRLYTKFLSKNGMNIGENLYIANNVYFDGSDYSLITLGDFVGISRDVILLTHDFSMNTVFRDLEFVGKKHLENQYKKNKLLVLKPIEIERNSFIGCSCIILQGTHIGRNCLIGAGSVVKGNIPDNSVVIGNPARIIAKTDEWLTTKSKNFEEEMKQV